MLITAFLSPSSFKPAMSIDDVEAHLAFELELWTEEASENTQALETSSMKHPVPSPKTEQCLKQSHTSLFQEKVPT